MNPKEARNNIDKHMLADGMSQIIDLNKSHGSWLVDARDNREYLDLFSMFASLSVGYNHPYILEHKEKLGEIAVNKTTLSDIYNVYYAEFVETFDKIAMPSYLKNAFFIDGGALAVENALKAAFDWKRRMNMSKGSKVNGDKVIYFNQAFHGRTGYTLTLTNTADPRKTMYFPKFPWFKVDNPYINFPLTSDVLEDLIKQENAVLESIKEIVENNTDDIAALILEPIQGEGGDNHFRDEFIVQLKNICDNNDIILIFDEVQTGIGLTGKMWAHEHFSVKPDIISFGKKTQVCGMLAGDKIYNLEDNVFKESSRINSTFGGNLTDMYRFKLILEIIDNEYLLDNTIKMGNYLLDSITSLSDEFPGYVTNPRGKGLFCAFDMPSGIERDKLISILLDKNIMILGSGLKSIRFRPHLNVLKEDLDICINAIHKSIKEMLN